ncbi:MAG: TatD family hydrolase [Methylococcaceae bacterium]|jgi:TatD DNase family protein|nr:TatD family hydrolase [Methylococcaceae bacterium]MDD1636558.1 TatD family hydrolase [Methylococcaceae bacterium]MDD1643452.1 TatD family hydrolase [Methylococcaceae bacterium]OYV20207.1 MAG: TatD DNase family protein [Methylococcaceae bacterium NSM2-1]
MLIDSHCHLDRIDLKPYQNDFACFMHEAEANQIEHLLCIAIDLESYPAMLDLVAGFQQISVTVGVHPNVQDCKDPSVDELIALGQPDKVIGIGETGLDYFRSEGDLSWQHQRFRNHIRAAKALKKPLIIHTREAKNDTLRILKEEDASEVGGVIHCFTEDWEFAKMALDLNFYISFSGIVTFNSAAEIKEVAKKVPAGRFLIETDSPYLAPVPFRGRPNYPTYVRYVAEQIAELRGTSANKIAELSTENFYALF